MRAVSGGVECVDLGMGLTGLPVPAFPDNLVFVDDDAAYARIGPAGVLALAGESYRPRHIGFIAPGNLHHGSYPGVTGLLFQAVQFSAEFAQVLKAAVNRGKANIGHIIELA